jgi:hypothetical protein
VKAIKVILISIVAISCLSFYSIESILFEFKYPKRKKSAIQLKGDFEKFDEEWRGSDYYYSSTSEDSIICSILYYKLNKDEQKIMVDPFGGIINAGIPFIFFSENSKLKKYEQNKSGWGETTDDFIFRQNDILEFQGIKLKQKHMYGYAMLDKDLFVNIHLSKVNFTQQDSTNMRNILGSLVKVK